jgi:pimeloyl-ACP methyl ester carboxylesterase
MRLSDFRQKFTGIFFLITLLYGNFSTFAQTRRATTAAPNKAQVAANQSSKDKKDCKSGYTGAVNYTKTVATTSSGKYGSYTHMKRTYQANIVVRDDGRQQGSTSMSEAGLTGSFNLYGQATASVSENDNRLDVSEKDEYCSISLKGAGKAQRVHCESKYNRKTEATGTSADANVYIGLKGRTMILSLGNLPKLSGMVSTESSSSCTGTCSPQKPVGSSSSVEVHNAGEKNARTEEDKITFNPQSFNRLAGSWTRTEPTPGGTVTETLTWNLSRCAPALEIADVRFEHKKVPNPDKWVGIDPLAGTIDGNIVKIKAKVFNNGGDTAYANVKFSELKSNEPLPDGAVSVAVNPGEFREVEYEWDTTGYAWNDNQKNQSEREIKVELESGNTETAKIKILPKPVIMVHGLWSNETAWAEYPIYLREAHSFAWQGFAVGADPAHGKMSTGHEPGNYRPTNTIYQNARELEKQIKYTRESMNAWHVDIVAHSMGGLISRQYINSFMTTEFDRKPVVTHLVMLGTPNQGSPCADIVNYLFEENGHNQMEAMRELKPIIVRAFNTRVTDRKQVLFSVMAGTPLPFTCHEKVQGDLVVPIQSALYTIPDRGFTTRNHLDMTGKEDFQAFVLPRLAVGPKKARTEFYMSALENNRNENFAAGGDVDEKDDRYGFNQYFQKASYKRAETVEADNDDSLKNLTTRQKVELQANQTKEIEIPVNDASYAGVVLVATPAVSATLTDASGAILGVSSGGREAVKQLFRTIAVDKKVTKGVWKLKLENLGSIPTIIFAAGFAGDGGAAAFTVEAGKPNVSGTVPLIAKLAENNAPVLNAKITGKIVGEKNEINFYDDGKHGDGAASDGVYGASVEKMPKGEYFVEAKAEANNQTKIAVAMITIGGATTPAKTTSVTRTTPAKRKN